MLTKQSGLMPIIRRARHPLIAENEHPHPGYLQQGVPDPDVKLRAKREADARSSALAQLKAQVDATGQDPKVVAKAMGIPLEYLAAPTSPNALGLAGEATADQEPSDLSREAGAGSEGTSVDDGDGTPAALPAELMGVADKGKPIESPIELPVRKEGRRK